MSEKIITINLIELKPAEKKNVIELLPFMTHADLIAQTAIPYRTPWVRTSYHPVASIHIYGKSLVGLQADVIVSNVEFPDADLALAKVVAANVAASDVITITNAAAFACVLIKVFTSGSLGIRYAGTPQS